jgi:hypothetical protein
MFKCNINGNTNHLYSLLQDTSRSYMLKCNINGITNHLYSLLQDTFRSYMLKCNINGITNHLQSLVQDTSRSYMLKCNIDGNTNHLHEGLSLGLVDDRERHSAVLGRTALFKGSSVITSLPEYLTVQMVRFFFKAAAQQKAKVLRKVSLLLTSKLLG